MKPKLIFGIIAIVGFTSLLMYNFGNSISTYVNFEEADGRQISHVIGTWDNTQAHGFSRETLQFTFHMKDQDGNVRRVVYPRPKPNNFEQATQLVVVGEMRNNVFHANEMLMKCPSKYNDPSQLEFVNAEES
ncbi:MAG: cytochrome c maturation protein CcmE [Balneolaceae bacterium]|nr:MAG: cytochrome c maturation protein CcmE [Balneolaceae bacterium]